MPRLPWRRPLDHAWFIRDRVWENEVVQRIRDGRGAPQMDSSSDPAIPVWGGQPPLHTGDARWAREETEAESLIRQELRDELRAALAANAANVKKKRDEKRARDAEIRAWKEGLEERERRRLEEVHRLSEKNRILSSKWICTVCGGAATIRPEGDGYQLTCTGAPLESAFGLACGKTAWGKHESLMKVINR